MKGLGVVSQIVGIERKKKEIEKKKESSEKVDSGHHAAACKEKFQPCCGMFHPCPDMVIVFVFMQTGSGLHVATCPPYIYMQRWQRTS